MMGCSRKRYGGVSPRSQWGRIAALIYALFGIPLMLLYLSAMGEGLSSVMRCIFRRFRSPSTSASSSGTNSASSSTSGTGGKGLPSLDTEKRPHTFHNGSTFKSHNHHHSTSYTSPTVPISVCIMILICYISLGAVLFHKIQQWGVLESLYFCFASLSTIGFGDLSPQSHLAQYIASGYILVGMAVVAMCFSLIQSELIAWLRKFGVQDQIPSPINEEVALVTRQHDLLANSYSSLPRRSSNSFQRNTPVRRSTGVMENHVEYFVPRSIRVGDLALPPPKRSPVSHIQPTTTLLPPPPASLLVKPREKMVTFEDESKCPHGVPTTPRKGPIMGDVFM
uniref:Putative potassium channel subfamily protein k member 2 n=1 Tax=Lutzomyia longipalpis TaxID=7200 RepID=A0A1B0CM84_LUTLO